MMTHPVCLECIGNVHLRTRLASDARNATCAECGEMRASVPFVLLAERIDEAFRPNFELTPYDQSPGAAAIFADIAGIGSDLAFRIEEHLSEIYGEDSEGNPYDYSTGFKRCRTPQFWQEERWERFCNTLRKTARHINAEAIAWLDDVFADIGNHRTRNAESVIRRVLPGEPGSHFYRARVASNEDELRRILSQPVLQIGPLPPGIGQGGRLNAAGIPGFYGAIDEATCVAEIRPPVGAQVVVSRFEVLRPLQLLDFSALENLVPEANPFDPEFEVKRDRAHFLRSLGEQISRPVMPGAEMLGYVPTQVVAEYLEHRLAPPIDGILYHSTQRGLTGGNVMLFNRSARVEPFPHHTHYIDLDIRTIDVDADDYDDSIRLDVQEIDAIPLPDPLAPLNGSVPQIAAPLPDTFVQPDIDDDRPLSLRLMPEDIAVHEIRAVAYELYARQVVTSTPWPRPHE
ncbi:RES family NAD+ phosphorylase [Sphingopyxis macrogoltabida]|uniref:RES domain-containing protein n=1 Tax=Sphingopyxis macrogoltabida TaxID=33050 RepID=A0AAC9AZM5_SPHMC|nr:RES family NAD+ phosphorylase [Sphingopyxis macrogoltabida]AMU92842.1 hypothetical protein ATM17_31800 [Sphingopyxis macrogoltabida]